MQEKNMRAHIVNVLTQIEKEQSYIQLVLKSELEGLDAKDKAFVNEIVYGTVKYQIKLDYVINQFSKTSVSKMKPFIRHLMRMSVYQIMYLDKVPTSAVINEAVKLVHKRKMSNLSGFVNGVLRGIARGIDTIQYPDQQKNQELYLSVMYSVPEWMAKLWTQQYGFDTTQVILEALNSRAHVCIRRNCCAGDEKGFFEALKTEGIEVIQKGVVPESYYVHIPQGVHNSGAFQMGEFSVQDESAMLVGYVLCPRSGDRVLDMCSAPGGKTTHLAELMHDKGEIVALDVHEHKIELIEKQAERIGLSIIKAQVQDGTIPVEEWYNQFDKVLLDAPCSGLGIIKRKPDIRYKKQYEDIKAINEVQKALVKNAVQYVKPGGVLVYSTCTLTRLENEEMVEYIQEALNMEASAIEEYLPEELKKYLEKKNFIQILPQMMNSDGFFIAKFKKKEVK